MQIYFIKACKKRSKIYFPASKCCPTCRRKILLISPKINIASISQGNDFSFVEYTTGLIHKCRAIHTQRDLIKVWGSEIDSQGWRQRLILLIEIFGKFVSDHERGRASSATDPHLERTPLPLDEPQSVPTLSLSLSLSISISIFLVAVCSVRSCGHVDRSLPCNERNTVFPSRFPSASLLLLVPTSVSPWARALKRAGAGQKRRNPSRLGRRSGF